MDSLAGRQLMLKLFSPFWKGEQILTFLSGSLFIPHHMIVVGYYGFMLDVRVSFRLSIRQSISRTFVHPSVFHFRMITCVNINGFSPNLVCALILWTSGLGLLMANFVKLLQSYLPETCPYFHFRMITWVNINGFSTNLIIVCNKNVLSITDGAKNSQKDMAADED